MTKQEEIRERFNGILGRTLCIVVDGKPYISMDAIDEAWQYLHSQGIMLKVDRELPEIPSILFSMSKSGRQTEDSVIQSQSCLKAQQDMLAAGYVAVESLC